MPQLLSLWVTIRKIPRETMKILHATTKAQRHSQGNKCLQASDSFTTEKADLKLNIQKTRIMASGLITSWEIDGETVETVSDNF